MKNFKENIKYFDNHLIVAYKPAGMLSQRDNTGDDSILEYVKSFIAIEFDKPGKVFIGSIHRLDRPAEGLMVFAKTSKALERMNKAFRKGEIKKTYLAIVEGKPQKDKATLIDYLWKDTRTNRVKRYSTPAKDRKKAILHYTVLASKNNISLVEIELKTGRPHQIRVQLAGIGCPIVGDLKYNANSTTGDYSICLLSKSLEFVHPVTKELLRFSCSLPANRKYWDLFSDVKIK